MAVNVTQNNTIVEVSGSQSTIEVNPTTSDIVVSGAGNTNVTIATAGAKGSTGEKGSSGSAGTSGTSGQDGTLFGSSGTSGTNGTAGSGGTSGTNGTAGSGGTSGTNGTAGSGGSSGTSGITQDLTSLNNFTSSLQTEVDGLSAATSSYLTELPSGTISGSSQITDVITDSYISSSAASSGFGSGGGDSHTHSNKTQLDTINQNLSTTSNVLFNDITASGDVTLSGSLSLNDNEEITFGDSNDLKLYHNGTQNYIDGIGTTIIRGNWLYLRKSGTTSNFLIGKADGAVELYHDDVKKFETTADGISMTGKITNLSEPTASQDAATKAYVDASLDGSISGSSQISDLGYVSSSTVDFIQVMTSASYAAITPVSGTLYIIQG